MPPCLSLEWNRRGHGGQVQSSMAYHVLAKMLWWTGDTRPEGPWIWTQATLGVVEEVAGHAALVWSVGPA